MAGAEANLPNFSVKKPNIPKRLLNGSKFLKWPKSDDDSMRAVPLTLRVDPKGYFIYWNEPNKDAECLEISSIRDTRVGKYAREPKQEKLERYVAMDPELRKMVSLTFSISERCFTIVHGPNFVDLTFLNFIAVEVNAPDVVKEWADFLLELAYHPTTRHISVQTAIEKMFTKLKHETNQFGEIPVKKLIKLFGGRSKRVETALSSVGLASGGHKKTIHPSEFQLPRFKKLIQLCCQRPEMDTIFSGLVSGARKMSISHQKVKEFVNTEQRDPKLNEILYPYYSDDESLELVQSYEPNMMFGQKGQLTQEGFDSYLQSDDNLITGVEYYAEHQDMSLPLSHYFINSSHNTYLTGTQYRSKSSAEMYRQVLLSGCRCVELDCWEGDDGPIINHGFTLCTPIPFKDAIVAINESAFKTSPFPVILSFENHVESADQQSKMAQCCRDIFKEKLLIDPLETYPIEIGVPLPSPKDLLYKIIIKNKKQKQIESKKQVPHCADTPTQNGTPGTLEHRRTVSTVSINSIPKTPRSALKKPPVSPFHSKSGPSEGDDSPIRTPEKNSPYRSPPTPKHERVKTSGEGQDDADAPLVETMAEEVEKTSLKKDLPDEEEELIKENGEGDGKEDEESDDEGQLTTKDFEENAKDSGTASKESKAYEAMSSLVNYVQPVRFKRFDISEKKNRSNEISSFTESTALRHLTYFPYEFVRYNRRQTSRIYPKGARVDSSNYLPQVFWNVGCQFVALNFQVLDVAMQLNLGLFEFNGSTGFLVKPEHMREKDRTFDPFAKNIDGIVASTLTIRIISGQFLSQQKLSTFVEVDMFGLPNDTVRRAHKTKTVDNNSINPYYDSSGFVFEKIVLPSLAMLRIAVSDTSGNLIGHRLLKVEGLRPGYRYITLRNEGNQPLNMASLFVYIQVKDFVPEAHKDFANWLANPIPYWEKKKQEDKEREARVKAMRMLLDPAEIKRVDEHNPYFKRPFSEIDAINRTLKPNPFGDGKSEEKKNNDVMSLDVVDDKDKLSDFLEKFEPRTIEDMKLDKSYLKLIQRQEDGLLKLKKKHKEEFIECYCVLFGNIRRTSVFEAFRKVYRKKEQRINMSPTQPEAVKRDELMQLLRHHIDSEKNYQLKDIDNFMEKFATIIKDRQKKELSELSDQSNKEQNNVQKKKDMEKDQRMKKIPPNLSRDEFENRKKDITLAHIEECVRERSLLLVKQEDREKAVRYQQEETFSSLEIERKKIEDKIEAQYREKMQNIYSIYDSLCSEVHGNDKATETDDNDGAFLMRNYAHSNSL